MSILYVLARRWTWERDVLAALGVKPEKIDHLDKDLQTGQSTAQRAVSRPIGELNASERRARMAAARAMGGEIGDAS